MVEMKAKRVRGRPKGSRNKTPSAKKINEHVDQVMGEHVTIDRGELAAELAVNGRDEAAYEPDPLAGLSPYEQYVAHDLRKEQPEPAPPPKVVLPDLFVHRVQNGYIVRPAYAQGDHRTSSDVRTWVVATKEALSALVVELIAEPVVHTAPVRQSQDYYSPPLIVETATGPMR
jgi:hypothetical protein